MNEQQRAVAAVQGYVTVQVIVERVSPAAGERQQGIYTVRVFIKTDDATVTMTPDPPNVRERQRALMEARRLLQQREERAETGHDRQMLTHAVSILTREIDALP